MILHRCLFNLNATQGSLFDLADATDEPPARLQRCLKRDVTYARTASDWREVQANQGMAAMLMPRPVFVAACRVEFDRLGAGRVDQGTPLADALARRLAGLFQVSRQAAAIRLGTLALLAVPGQREVL